MYGIWRNEPSSNNRVFLVALHAGQGMASLSLWRRTPIQKRGR